MLFGNIDEIFDLS